MNGRTKEDFLREAIGVASDNVASGGGPFGAIVVRDGEVVARAANRVTTANDPTAHAEVEAIREACLCLTCAGDGGTIPALSGRGGIGRRARFRT